MGCRGQLSVLRTGRNSAQLVGGGTSKGEEEGDGGFSHPHKGAWRTVVRSLDLVLLIDGDRGVHFSVQEI